MSAIVRAIFFRSSCAGAMSLAMAAAIGCGCGGASSDSEAKAPPGERSGDMAWAIPEPAEHVGEPEVTDRVSIRTSMGSMVVGLYGEAAPKTVANFLSYVDRGFYSGKVFHRVIPGFMIQGGGFDEALKRAPTEASIPLEIIPGLEHSPGVVSMARTSDPNSATSQFFVCVASPAQLNGAYAIFGKVEEGYEVAVAISNVRTGTREASRGAMGDVPVQSVVIESIERL